ncbi:MAG: O-antigen ligase family protein [Actinomycetota bacterium]|nr:O-antigen ligase family protein [Actinomycetota bacterium]
MPLVGAGAIAFGLLVATRPLIASGLLIFVLLLAFAFLAPVANLLLLLFATAIVPYGIANRFGVGGGSEAASFIVSDILLIGGLLNAGMTLLQQPLGRRPALAGGAVVIFLAAAFLQLVHGIQLGREASVVGNEFRPLLGFGALLMALPIVRDQRARERLFKGLLVLGLVLGLWGVGQYLLGTSYAGAEDVGVREGVAFTTAEIRGSVQGGLYAFPVALCLAFAALMSGYLRSLAVRLTLVAVMVLNGVALLLTYERTFWLASVLALAFISARSGAVQRARFLLWAPALLIIAFSVLSTVAPNELAAARERLLSLGQYEDDDSLRYRQVESQRVLEQIYEHPLIGSGFAATVYFGRPWAQVPPKTFAYTHNGYLWLAWKLGIPAALLLFLLLVTTVVWRGPPAGDPLFASVRIGAQGALLALLVVSVTFPAIRAVSVTVAMGMLAGMCATPRAAAISGGEGRGAANGSRDTSPSIPPVAAG